VRRMILGAAALALLLVSCTGASRLHVFQPAPIPTVAPVAVPVAMLPVHDVKMPMFQRGIDIDFYTYPGQDIVDAASTDVAYVKRLHANAVSISFPFFMTGPNAKGVYASSSTPTPAQIGILVRDAVHAGLYVSIRPLLDETNLHRSRVGWIPADLPAWFASYRHLLQPYAKMARQEHAAEFIVGAELTKFTTAPGWNGLDRALRKQFHGALGCANNWNVVPAPGNCGDGVRETIDAYKPMHSPLSAAWAAYDRALPPGTVVTEVGIAAAKGAYSDPPKWHWPVKTLDQQVQVRWFTAACHAAARTNLGGVYFWSMGLSLQIGTGPTLADQGLWAGGAGARAIAACFAPLQKAD
jgi:hypothetical protein